MKQLAMIATLLLASAAPSLADDINTNADVIGADSDSFYDGDNIRSDYEPLLDETLIEDEGVVEQNQESLNEQNTGSVDETEEGTSASGTDQRFYDDWDGVDLEERPIPPMAGDRSL
jgi:hypothetical protein